MKFNKVNILLSIVIAILIAIIVAIEWPSNTIDKYASQKREIDSLSKMISVLEVNQLKYDSLIACYTDSLKFMDQKVDSTKKEITQIQNKYAKKIKDIHNATHNELSGFFSDRYK